MTNHSYLPFDQKVHSVAWAGSEQVLSHIVYSVPKPTKKNELTRIKMLKIMAKRMIAIIPYFYKVFMNLNFEEYLPGQTQSPRYYETP